ncbi:MAG TPA: hypothetical protein VF369_03245 [candidate division Zixibacteria bacterium]
MKHKTAYWCVLAVAVGLLVFAGVSFSAAPHKATGGVGFTAYDLDRRIDFTAHEAYDEHPAKGNLHYSDANHDWYDVDVTCVTIVNEWAFFSGPVLRASQDGWVGQWVLIAVFDGGTPGRKGDKVWGTFASSDPGCQPFRPPVMFDVTNGNLQVQ